MVEKLNPEFIDNKNLFEQQDKFFEKIKSFKEKINNKTDNIDDIIEIFYYHEWYSMRFEVWTKYNLYIKKINKPKKWSIETLILYMNEIIKKVITKFINYLDYKYGDICEFCEDYECFLSSCIFCAKFGCMKCVECVECYTDKNFGSCFNCNIKQ